ncbi:NAD(P)-dependent alcohol dehydrogenase [Microbacterium sp. S308A+]|uniref:NAD(P)-dependent alcohol dehydrogenase n=1 Tax=Microbacterium sp. S308A+ TaxID=3415135 RepID=UPI003C7D2C21
MVTDDQESPVPPSASSAEEAEETTMPAWVQRRYGPAARPRQERRPAAPPPEGAGRRRLQATALNAGDVRIMAGDPLLVRPVFGLFRPKNPVRGMDVAGTVAALGDGVSELQVGDAVVGELPGGGGLARFATVRADRLARRPDGVPAEVAACLPIAAGTAWQAWELARVPGLAADDPSPGSVPRVLVLGASGGVGIFAVQLAALRGAEVWATCGERNRALVEEAGAVRVFDHRAAPLGDLPGAHFDAVVDVAGGVPVRALQRLVRDGGSVVLVTGDGGRVLGPVPRMIRAAAVSIGSRRPVRPLAATARPEVVAALLDLVAAGRLAPMVERVWGFAEAPAALAHLEAGHAAGKTVVRIDG